MEILNRFLKFCFVTFRGTLLIFNFSLTSLCSTIAHLDTFRKNNLFDEEFNGSQQHEITIFREV